MKITYNASAMFANNALTRNDNKLEESLARLSSGLKVVKPKDDPSGLAMSKRMNAQIEGINKATQNAGDGVSIIEIADGTLSEVHSMIQRMNELSVKAATGVLTDDDRRLINDEVDQLKAEITRIAKDTEFNGQSILDGSFDLRGYTSDNNVKVAYYGDNVLNGNYVINSIDVTFNEDGTINTDAGLPTMTAGTSTAEDAREFPADAKVTKVDGNIITITGADGFELKIKVINPNGGAGDVQFSGIGIDLEGFGALDMQIGANEGQQLAIRIPEISLENMGIAHIDLSTQDGATDALSRMPAALQYVSDVRSRLGAYQNRLEHTISSLELSSENMTAAYSRIMDVDMAEEMTQYTTMQVLSQASTSMLAQANQRPSQVLQLLQ